MLIPVPASSVGFLVCLHAFQTRQGLSTVIALLLNPWWCGEMSGLWFPPGDRHSVSGASGLTTTPRSLARGRL